MTDLCTPTGSADSQLFVSEPLRTSAAGGDHGLGSFGSLWSYADNFGILDRGIDCSNVHIARLTAGVQRADLDVQEISHATGSPNVIG